MCGNSGNFWVIKRKQAQHMNPHLYLKRAYEAAAKEDGYRVLVDRLWPRGISKEEAKIDEWAKDLAPTGELRKWYDHDPARWDEFRKKYEAELKENEALHPFMEAHAKQHTITLVYAAKEEALSNAVVLKAWLEKHWKK